MIVIKDNQLFSGDAEKGGTIYPLVPLLLEPEEIRAGLKMCLVDPLLIEQLMRQPELALFVFVLFAYARLGDGCTHGGMQHRMLEDLLAPGALSGSRPDGRATGSRP
jgi:hypothetical protein